MVRWSNHLAGLSAILISSSVLAAGPYGSIEVGNWKGGAYTNDANGTFSHCAAGAPYRSGIQFFVAINAAGGWSLGFAHQSWQLRPGTTIPIDLTFDGRSQFHVFGTVVPQNNHLVVVPMPGSSDLVVQFRKSRSMAAVANGQLFQFDLTTTSQLLPALASCVTQAHSIPLASIHIRGPIPVATPTPPVAAPPTAPATTADFGMVPPAEAAVMLSNLFNAAGLQGWRLEPPKQGEDWINFRLATGTNGFYRAARGLRTKTADDYAAYVISNLSGLCKGNYLSGKQSVPSVDGSVVRKVITTCRGDSKGDYATETTIIRQADGFLMELSHFVPAASETSPGGSIDDASKNDRAAMVDAALRMRDTR